MVAKKVDPVPSGIAELFVSYGMANGKEKKSTAAPESEIKRISEGIIKNSNDIGSIKAMLSEIELIAQIIIPLIRSPNDMSGDELIWESEFSGDVGDALDVIRKYFTNDYKIESMIEPICRAIMFDTGSYVVATFPENSITAAIRNGFKGDLNEAKKIDFESFSVAKATNEHPIKMVDEELGIVIEANPFSLYRGQVNKLKSQHDMEHLFSDYLKTDMESLRTRREGKVPKDKDVTSVYFSTKNDYETKNEIDIDFSPGVASEEDTMITGLATKFTLPSASVIPIVSPHDNTRAMGYYICLDNNYHPIKMKTGNDAYRKLEKFRKVINDESLKNLAGITDANLSSMDDSMLYEKLTSGYETKLIEKLQGYLKHNLNIEELDSKYIEDISLTLLWRTMERRKTNIVYVPAELITYYAFSRNEYGVGKTMIEDHMITVLQYATILVANNMSAISNSTLRRELLIQLPKHVPNKDQLIEMITDKYTRNRARNEFLQSGNYTDIVQSLCRSSTTVKVETEDEEYPNLNIGVNERASPSKPIDTEYETKTKNRFAQIWGLTPSIFDETQPLEFASSLAQQSMLLSKKITNWQSKLEPLMTDNVRKQIRFSPKLIKQIKEAGIKDEDMREFIDTLLLKFPRANVTKYDGQSKALDSYTTLLTNVFTSVFDRDMFDRDLFENSESFASVVASLKSMYIRKFMMRNNILPEVAKDLFQNEGDLFSEMKEDYTSLSKIMADIKKHMDKLKKKSEDPVVSTDAPEPIDPTGGTVAPTDSTAIDDGTTPTEGGQPTDSNGSDGADGSDFQLPDI